MISAAIIGFVVSAAPQQGSTPLAHYMARLDAAYARLGKLAKQDVAPPDIHCKKPWSIVIDEALARTDPESLWRTSIAVCVLEEELLRSHDEELVDAFTRPQVSISRPCHSHLQRARQLAAVLGVWRANRSAPTAKLAGQIAEMFDVCDERQAMLAAWLTAQSLASDVEGWADATWKLAILAQRDRRIDDEARHLRTIVDSDATRRNGAAERLADLLRGSGRFAEGASLLRAELLRGSGANVRGQGPAWLDLARLELDLGNGAAALDAVDRAAASGSNSFCGNAHMEHREDTAVVRGAVLEALGRYSEAAISFATVAPVSEEATIRLEALYSAAGQRDDLDRSAVRARWVPHMLDEIDHRKRLVEAGDVAGLIDLELAALARPHARVGPLSHESSRLVAQYPDVAVPLLERELFREHTEQQAWLFETLGRCGSEEAAAVLTRKAEAYLARGVYLSEDIARALRKCGQAGEASLARLEASHGGLTKQSIQASRYASTVPLRWPALVPGRALPAELDLGREEAAPRTIVQRASRQWDRLASRPALVWPCALIVFGALSVAVFVNKKRGRSRLVEVLLLCEAALAVAAMHGLAPPPDAGFERWSTPVLTLLFVVPALLAGERVLTAVAGLTGVAFAFHAALPTALRDSTLSGRQQSAVVLSLAALLPLLSILIGSTRSVRRARPVLAASMVSVGWACSLMLTSAALVWWLNPEQTLTRGGPEFEIGAWIVGSAALVLLARVGNLAQTRREAWGMRLIIAAAAFYAFAPGFLPITFMFAKGKIAGWIGIVTIWSIVAAVWAGQRLPLLFLGVGIGSVLMIVYGNGAQLIGLKGVFFVVIGAVAFFVEWQRRRWPQQRFPSLGIATAVTLALPVIGVGLSVHVHAINRILFR